ncbi:hypothetical protein GQ457_12G010480 [Hibiscus cannabinus]
MTMFEGKTSANLADAEYWLKKLQRLFVETNFLVDPKLRVFGSLLEGKTQNWWEAKEDIVVASQITWDYFRESFRDCYVRVEYLAKCMDDFLNLMQRDMTVHDYEIEYLRLIQYAPGLVTTKKDKGDWFLKGIRETIRRGVALHHDSMYKELTCRARTVERLEFEHQGYSRARSVTSIVLIANVGGLTSPRRGRQEQSRGSYRSTVRQPWLVYSTRMNEDRDELNFIAGSFSIHVISCYALLDNGSTHSYVVSVVSEDLEITIEDTGNTITVHSLIGNLVKFTRVYKILSLEIQREIFPANLMELPFGV